MRDFLAAVRGLTVRGRSFLAAGGACVASAAVIGEQDLLAVGALLVALPLFAAGFVARTRYRLACTRRLEPPRVTAGDTVSVRIRLDNVSRLPSSVLLVEDTTPNLGLRARFVVDQIEPGGSRDLSYPLRAGVRGRYQVGPLTIRLTDPFGLCELERSFRGRDELIVAPALERLPLTPLVGSSSLNNEVRRSSARAGEDDSTTRPYRSGDDLRKVHWKTTARLGELMVRRDERPLTGAATVLLDTRHTAWPEMDRDDPFSWAVGAAGSIAVNLARSGYGVRLIADTGVAATGPGNAVGALLDELAVIAPTPSATLSPALASLRSAEHSGMVVVVLGRTDQATASMIAGARPRNAPAIAVLVDLAGWGASPAAGGDLEVTRHTLTRHGWTVLVAGAGARLADTWPQIFRPGASAGRRFAVGNAVGGMARVSYGSVSGTGPAAHAGSAPRAEHDASARRAGAAPNGGSLHGGSLHGGSPHYSSPNGSSPNGGSANGGSGHSGSPNGGSVGGSHGRDARRGAAPAEGGADRAPADPTPPPPATATATGPLYRPGSPHEPATPATAGGGPPPNGRGW
ncbi:DUF58 domain-containing protein [Parafrankia sp. BMG5.11]|uniref:DUF58 domain-containing protein n=1 Tax=Parafrankia sp. BMG5.11 TaxID=222540 RepID=UPI00103ADE7A|nr:DUF58 domain-containing protein [Parafrankia sp. BMG5.11]TCJ36225.1 DUF58 domain-containing protein [Parafrankia sp. BMG5.11]